MQGSVGGQLQLFLGFRRCFRNSGFQVRPREFVRIEFRCVWRKEEQFHCIGILPDKFSYHLCLVSRVSIDDEKYLAIHSGDQTIEKFTEYAGVHTAFHSHEVKAALCIDRR